MSISFLYKICENGSLATYKPNESIRPNNLIKHTLVVVCSYISLRYDAGDRSSPNMYGCLLIGLGHSWLLECDIYSLVNYSRFAQSL